MQCKYCSREAVNSNSLKNHERLCKLNPDRQYANTLAATASASKKVSCRHCNEQVSRSNLKKHENACGQNPVNLKDCPVCGQKFSSEGVTCSHSCANTYFRSGPDNGNWQGGTYRTIAKLHHEMKCVVCGEDKIVAIHHMDENHDNNDPKNLVPLCPTHHVYIHSRYKSLIIDKVNEYICQ